MFNSGLKQEALKIHESVLKRYNQSNEQMGEQCEKLYAVRRDSVALIEVIRRVVNSMANTPKEFNVKLGQIGEELQKFVEIEEYAKEAYTASVKTGASILGGAAAGLGVAAMAPTAMMGIATTFGSATTGTAISALSGAAAQKAAVAWVGRTFVGFAVKGSAGMAAGQAFLALAGPIGWGVTATTTSVSLMSLTRKNKEIADQAVEEAKTISQAREALEETNEKIKALTEKTRLLYEEMRKQRGKIVSFMDQRYPLLSEEDQYFWGATVNHTLSLAALLNETIH